MFFFNLLPHPILALLETSKLIETERMQFQTELDRRLLEFEKNHTASLTELESSRRALIEQLAASESAQQLLQSDLAVAHQKLLAKVCFIYFIEMVHFLKNSMKLLRSWLFYYSVYLYIKYDLVGICYL